MDPSALDALQGLGAEAARNDPAARRRVAREFEALLMGEMLKQAQRPLLGDAPLSGGSSARMWREMFLDQALRSGTGGFGLADAIERELGAGAHAEETK